MRKITLTLFILLATFAVRAESLLSAFEQNIKALGRYRVQFEVTLDEHRSAGYYIVEGDNFYISVDGIEWYVADGVKYSVDSNRKEVVVDSTDSLGDNLLSNPAKGFSSLEKYYTATNINIDGQMAVELKAKDATGDERIVIQTTDDGKLPKVITYSYSNAAMVINIVAMESIQTPLPRFDEAKYPSFDMVDNR